METKMDVLQNSSTKIVIRNGLLDELYSHIEDLKPHKIAIITDTSLAKTWLPKVKRSLGSLGEQSKVIIVRKGEKSKTLSNYRNVIEKLISSGFTRGSLLIALGGGSVCDLTGFVASTYMRGMSLVFIPTTLLAQVDASIGGKNGIDYVGKNMLGTIYHPKIVVIDPEVLSTLSTAEYLNGLAEVVKTAIISNEGFFDLLENNVDALLLRKKEILETVIQKCINIKKAIVEQDPTEKGLRMVLNLGHTIGHAVEKTANYNIKHGFAVSIGMIAEARIATEVLGFQEDNLLRLGSLLDKLGLPTKISLDPRTVLESMKMDKKFWYGKPKLALPKKIGEMEIVEVPFEVISKCMKSYVCQ
jgi:3-dehydroquinate synthase